MAGLYTEDFVGRLQQGIGNKLEDWGLPPETTIKMLNVSENATFLAEDPFLGKRVIFRVHRPDYHTEQEIESELKWISALQQENVVHTAAPMPTIQGNLLHRIHDSEQERLIVAFEFVKGEEPAIHGDLVPWFEKLGEVTARLHVHSRNWKRPEGFMRKYWNIDTMVTPEGYWGDWREAIGMDEAKIATISDSIAIIRKRLDVYGQEADRYGLVHADLRLANLLINGADLSVIDFDDTGFCWFAYDFAAAISFHEFDPNIPSLQDAWIKGYRSVAPFSEEDEAELPTFILLRRILLTAWLASHAETPTGQELGGSFTEGTVKIAETFIAANQ